MCSPGLVLLLAAAHSTTCAMQMTSCSSPLRQKASPPTPLIDKVDAVSRDYGLEISTRKTKVMVTSEGRITPSRAMVTVKALKQVESFRYLGAVITFTGDRSIEIRSRLGIARSALNKFVRPRWPYDTRPSVRAEKYIRDAGP